MTSSANSCSTARKGRSRSFRPRPAADRSGPLERNVEALRRSRDFCVDLLEPLRPVEGDLMSGIGLPGRIARRPVDLIT